MANLRIELVCEVYVPDSPTDEQLEDAIGEVFALLQMDGIEIYYLRHEIEED